MVTATEVRKLADDGKRAFESARYESAADMFAQAARGYADLKDKVNAAELRNNLSVALLKLHKDQDALDAALGTDEIFEGAGDAKRQGMAIGNQAAALESLGRLDEALAAYERSAQLLADAGEGDLRSLVLKSAAGIQLRRGKLAESGIRMIGALEAKRHPSIFERVLRFFVRVAPH
jgi:tetratricopeptide (TPR) repeat protein